MIDWKYTLDHTKEKLFPFSPSFRISRQYPSKALYPVSQASTALQPLLIYHPPMLERDVVSVIMNLAYNIVVPNLRWAFPIIQHQTSNSEHPFMQNPFFFVGVKQAFIASIVVSPRAVNEREVKEEVQVSSAGLWTRSAWEIVPPCHDEAAVVLSDRVKSAADEVLVLAVSGSHDSGPEVFVFWGL